MRTLLLLRHAKSRWDREGVPDHDRPLKKRGKRDASRVGWFLLSRNLVPQLVISSTAKRARATATRVARASSYTDDIVFDDTLYAAGPMGYIQLLQDIDDRYHRVLIVGHNPEVELLLEVLTGVSETMRPSTLAQIELPVTKWAAVRDYVGGELVNLWHRKELKVMAKLEGVDVTAMANPPALTEVAAGDRASPTPGTKEELQVSDTDL